ncbi:hypothetical protein AGMMS50230_09670 [Spirochaetia bacterium]|nr:hypothetical protein AGMMS50230_09670 [Spirochaetia bacterium]
MKLLTGLTALTLAAVMSGCTTFQTIALTPPAKVLFGQGEPFSYEGLQVTGITKKGESKDISGDSKLKLSGYNPDRTGEQIITVDYRKVTASYTVTVVGVESFVITQLPVARQGLDFDGAALHLTVSYGGKITPRAVRGSDRGVQIAGYNKNSAGPQSVTVDYYGKTAVFNIRAAALTGLKITRPPDKVNYLSGEPLDLTGIKAAGTWQGVDDAPVPMPVYVSGFDTAVLGTQTVFVEALGKRASFTVTVKEPAAPVTWTPVQGFAGNITGISYGSGRFVAAGYNDDKPNEGIIAYSADGTSWIRTSAYINFKITRVFFGGGKFIIGGNTTERSYIAESSDGIKWQPQSPYGFTGECTAVAYGKGKQGGDIWVVVFDGSRIGYSNGGSWSGALIKNANNYMEFWNSRISGLFFDGSRFIAFDRTGRYLYSADGHWWEPGEGTITFGGSPVSNVIAGGGKLIGVGPDNALSWSLDGITWTEADHNGRLRGGSLNAAAYGFGMFVAVNSQGAIIYSRNGFVWTQVFSTTFGSTSIRDVAYGNGRFVAIGGNGRIAYSNKIEE